MSDRASRLTEEDLDYISNRLVGVIKHWHGNSYSRTLPETLDPVWLEVLIRNGAAEVGASVDDLRPSELTIISELAQNLYKVHRFS